MANEEMEVKEFNETIVIEPSSDADDEIIEPIEEKETPAPSSEEEKPESEPEVTEEETPEEPKEQEVAPIEVKEPKPVVGESPRERALRLETTRLKGLLRDQKRDELFVKKTVTTRPLDDDLAEYDQEELKRFETLATKMGFAKRDDLVRDTVLEKNNAEFDTFLEGHPEYLPENDRDATLWNRFKSEFSLYQPPQDPKTLRKVLNKVHNEIYGVQPVTNLNRINAQQQKLKVASHTGSMATRTSETSVKAPNSNIRYDMLKGFDEDELKELGA